MAVDTSYLTTQVNNIVSQLHGIFDEIGIPNHERESREEEVCASSLDDLPAPELTIGCSSSARYRKHSTTT